MSIFETSRNKIIDISREMLKRRIRETIDAEKIGLRAAMVDQLSVEQVASTVEATIATIVSSVADLSRKNYEDETVSILKIESHRRKIGFGEIPNPLNLQSYILYRVDIEFPGLELPSDHVAWCTHAAQHLFQLTHDRSEISHALKFADVQYLNEKLDEVMHAIAEVYDLSKDSDDYSAYLELEIEYWKSKANALADKRANFEFRAMMRDD